MDIPIELKEIPLNCIYTKINSQSIYFSEYNKKKFNVNGYIVDREHFDRYLSNQACNFGSDIQCNSKVVSINSNEVKINSKFGKKILKAKVIIGADGPKSITKKFIKKKYNNFDHYLYKHDNIYNCFQYKINNVNVDKNEIKIYTSRNIIPNGYAWMFPESENKVSIGIGMNINSTVNKKPLKDYLNKLIKSNTSISKELKYGIIDSKQTGFVPLYNNEPTVFNNILLVGDAAGHVMATNGGGIPFSIVGGKIAGISAADYITSNSSLTNYEYQWKKQYGINLLNSIKVKKLMDYVLSNKKLHWLLHIIPKKKLKQLQCGML